MFFKVMLVDDEIMALNNLKNMINWEESGYTIVASETNPRKALDSFKKFRPQIVFIDIMMPVMNGLELSEKILSLEIPVKVVILTSYKDFQYAKKAISIGVSNYLVKHEINKENLLVELTKLGDDLIKEEKNDRIVRHRLIRALIEGKNPYNIENKITNRHLGFDIGGMVFLFCKLDLPYPLLDDINSEIEKRPPIKWSEIDLSFSSNNMDVIGLNREEAVYVMYLKNVQFHDLTWRIVDKSVNRMQKDVFTKYGETITVCPVVVKNQLNSIVNLYNKVQKAFKYSIFLGKSSIINYEEMEVGEGNDNKDLYEYFLQIQNSLEELDGGKVQKLLKQIFEVLESYPYNFIRLRKFVDKLCALLDEFLKLHLQPSIYEFGALVKNKIELDEIFSIGEVYTWFENQFNFAVEKARNIDVSKYSRKVWQAMDLIHQQYNKDWSVEEIAEKLSISAVYLRRLFKNETGTTIVHYLTELRMKKAIGLLETGNYKVFEVSEMVGYNTSQYFSKVFRNYTGKSPMDFVSGI